MNYTNQGSKDTRSGYGDAMTELGRSNPNVVALCADLVGSLKIQPFIDENPERFFQLLTLYLHIRYQLYA